MNRVHEDNIVPKYLTGRWVWNVSKDELSFLSWKSEVLERELHVDSSSGFKFKAIINQMEEVIFRQEFARPGAGDASDTIELVDIKNLVLFLAPSEILTNSFLNFIHTRSVDVFLNALIIYFEYFIQLAEFILIRRDEVSGKSAQVESKESIQIKKIYSEQLAQYRIILAREYSVLLVGNGEMAPYYHLNMLEKISHTYTDRALHETLLAFATQVVWIAHHRRGYDVIDSEMNRLFRSDHFKLNRKNPVEYSKVEKQLLFGRYCERVNCRRQNTPLIQELSNIRRYNLPILWIGEKKYRGNDLQMQKLELEYIIPDSELCLIDCKHGILGNQKILYNTMLTLNWEKVRNRGYTDYYDPYRLVQQPHLEVPKLDEIKKLEKPFESYFSLKDKRFVYDKQLINKWKRRDKVVEYIRSGGLVIDVVEKCKKELNISPSTVATSVVGKAKAYVKNKNCELK